VRATVGYLRAEGSEGREGSGERTESSTSLRKGKECVTNRVSMCIEIVGRGFALRKWLSTFLLESRPMWRGLLA
jgi:hypothetical protein